MTEMRTVAPGWLHRNMERHSRKVELLLFLSQGKLTPMLQRELHAILQRAGGDNGRG